MNWAGGGRRGQASFQPTYVQFFRFRDDSSFPEAIPRTLSNAEQMLTKG